MKKLSIIIIIIIAVVAIWFYKKTGQEALVPSSASNTAEIINEVEGIDIGNTDSEFEEIDTDLNSR